MTTDTAAPATASTPLDIRTLSYISPLARDYATDFPRLAAFFAGNPADADAWRDIAARVLAHPAHDASRRSRLAAVLAAQQEARSAPAPARDAAARLAEPGTAAIVTGQQAGLFGGPIYTWLKALSAIALARQTTRDHGVPAVPVFWVEAEDHDWAEVRSCTVVTADDTVTTITAADPAGAGTQSVGSLRLDASIGEAIAALEQALPPTPFTADLLDTLRRCYAAGAGMGRACAQWLEAVLGPYGLVVFESDDPAAKPLVADLFAAEITSAPRTSSLGAAAGAALQGLGYHAQVEPGAQAAALFEHRGARLGITVEGDQARVDQTVTTRQALAARAATAPEDFGPSVLLRPLVQDSLFPTVCYVGGPGELAYFAQLKEIYAAHGLPMPLLQPRLSATFVDSNAARFLAKHQLALDVLSAQDERLLNDLLAAQLPASIEQAGEAAEGAIAAAMDALASAVPAVDATLEGAVRSAAGRMQDDLKKVRGKILQAAKKKDETLRRQFRHAQVQTFPGGAPQERAIGLVALLNRVGPAGADRVLAELPVTAGQHWIVTL